MRLTGRTPRASLAVAAVAALALAALLGLTATAASGKAKTKRISVKSNGNEVNTDNEFGSVSANGRFVTFESDGHFTKGDDGTDVDVFIHDRKTGKTKRISVKSNGKEAPGANSAESAISPNGRYVAFVSDGNLGGGDSNGLEDVYVRDRKTGKTKRASVTSSGHGIPYDCFNPDISANGRYVTFETEGPLTSGDTNGFKDIYVRDMKARKTHLVSVRSDGQQTDEPSSSATISNDGRFVAFQSDDQSMTEDSDYPPPVQADEDVFVRDLANHTTTRMSLKTNGSEADSSGGQQNSDAVISGNGRFVAFVADLWGAFVPLDTAPGHSDVYIHDRKTGRTSIVSVTSNGQLGSDEIGASERPLAISNDGNRVAFEDYSALVGNDTNMERDVYLRDRSTHKTTRVSVKSNGGQVTSGAGGQQLPALSSDGRWIVFQTQAKVTGNDAGDDFDVFERGPLG